VQVSLVLIFPTSPPVKVDFGFDFDGGLCVRTIGLEVIVAYQMNFG
jgi:hypothetical protein